MLQDNYEVLKNCVVEPLPPVGGKNKCGECKDSYNKLGDGISPPIFLKRNLKRMQKHRDGKTQYLQSNGIQQRVLPFINQIVYEEGEDTF